MPFGFPPFRLPGVRGLSPLPCLLGGGVAERPLTDVRALLPRGVYERPWDLFLWRPRPRGLEPEADRVTPERPRGVAAAVGFAALPLGVLTPAPAWRFC